MGIFTDNPVLRREVRARLRLRKVLASRPLTAVAAALGLVIAYFYVRALVAIGQNAADTARDLWGFLVVFLLLLIVVIAPALLSTAITQEREQQTWETLATTRLTGAEVLLGKGLARLMLACLPVLLLLPFLVSCTVRGAVDPVTLLLVLLFLVVTAAAYGALGLVCSFYARKTVTATVLALTGTLFLCVGTPILAALTSDFLRSASSDDTYRDPVVLWLNPFYALSALVGARETRGVGFLSNSDPEAALAAASYLIVSALAAAAGLYVLITRYRRAAREQ